MILDSCTRDNRRDKKHIYHASTMAGSTQQQICHIVVPGGCPNRQIPAIHVNIFMLWSMVDVLTGRRKEGRKEMFYITTHSTHIVKDHSHSEIGNPLPPHWLLFPKYQQGFFYMHHPTDQSWSTGWNEK